LYAAYVSYIIKRIWYGMVWYGMLSIVMLRIVSV